MISLEHFLRPTQKQLFKRLCKIFKDRTLISKGNFILVHGQAPVMLVAHLDTVHDKPVRDICLSSDKNILMSPQGIGGDDRCGVFALCHIFHSAQIKPWLLFTCDEEVGGLGAKHFCRAHKLHLLPNELDGLKFIIELDRKGKNDAVFYRCTNPDFEAFITSKGFKTAQGSFSDISLVAPELGIAAVNLSSGYYHAHSLHEYINRSHLLATIQKVIDIVAESTHHDFPKFDYIENLYPVNNSFRYHHGLTEHNDIPHNLSHNLLDIYEVLLDFYSKAELDSFRAEFGDHILTQIFHEEIEPLYF